MRCMGPGKTAALRQSYQTEQQEGDAAVWRISTNDELLRQQLQALRVQYQLPATDPEVPWYHGPLVRVVEQLMMWL